MAKERTRKYEKMGISANRYKELKYLARQYDSFHAILPDSAKMRRNAEKAAKIEAAAQAASGDLYPWIMENVTKGKSFEKLNPPCGSGLFFKARRQFFEKLDALIE